MKRLTNILQPNFHVFQDIMALAVVDQFQLTTPLMLATSALRFTKLYAAYFAQQPGRSIIQVSSDTTMRFQ